MAALLLFAVAFGGAAAGTSPGSGAEGAALASSSAVGAATSSFDPAPDKEAPTRSGLRGLGLGLELPMIGMASGIAAEADPAWGYTLGVALSWEVTPVALVRTYVARGKAFGGAAPLSYLEGGSAKRRAQSASWLGSELGIGAAYLFRNVDRPWTPYVGIDGALAFAGYAYEFAPGDPLADRTAAQLEGEADPDAHEAIGYGWLVNVRAGIRLELVRWLASQLELAVAYWPAKSRSVTNTYTNLDVRSVDDDVWLVRTTFSVRLGI